MAAPPDLSSTLAPLSTLLAAFNHRNKNQHRRSAWWSRFSLFRRAVRRLLAASSGSGVRGAADGVVRYARWMGEHVVPSSYVAFTQLAADNQYAPLGLVLLGALAQLNTTISPLLPAALSPRSLPNLAAQPANPPAPTLTRAPEPPLDLGESVSRDEFASAAPRESDGGAASVDRVSASVPVSKRAKSASARPVAVHAARDKFNIKDEDKEKDEIKKKKKKKKKATGTDFSDIFGSLT